jgi:glyoxylate/hydroxypyruvate reductase
MPVPAPIVFMSSVWDPKIWTEYMHALDPALDIRVYPDHVGAAGDIRYAVVWRPPHGALKTYPNLKCVFALGAGVDAIVSDPDYPRHVPLSRMIDDTLTQAMTEYVVFHVLYNHRRQRDFEALQRLQKWRYLSVKRAQDVRVGIMGLGVLGQDAARALTPLGYQLAGWSQSRKNVTGVESFAGASGLAPFLQRTDILVCLLPLTPDTRGILNRATLSQLPKGACLVNAARGGHMVPEDVLALLNEGYLSGASLDVFEPEPLPAESPFWTHPRVTVTPHAAAATDPRAIARHIVSTIQGMERGAPPSARHLVDLAKGY